MSIIMAKIVPKSWGHERWIVNNDLYCGKELFVKKYKRCSLHYHLIKKETFYVTCGKIFLEYINDYQDFTSENYLKQLILNRGDIFDIPVGMLHRFTGLEKSLILEFSTHHEDSDSYRLIKGD